MGREVLQGKGEWRRSPCEEARLEIFTVNRCRAQGPLQVSGYYLVSNSRKQNSEIISVMSQMIMLVFL